MSIRPRLARLEAAARLQDGPDPADDRGWLAWLRIADLMEGCRQCQSTTA